MSEIDYESLLTRYLQVVLDGEGTTFVSSADASDRFTPAEIAELKRLAEIAVVAVLAEEQREYAANPPPGWPGP
jgi:hypothetical protein